MKLWHWNFACCLSDGWKVLAQRLVSCPLVVLFLLKSKDEHKNIVNNYKFYDLKNTIFEISKVSSFHSKVNYSQKNP